MTKTITELKITSAHIQAIQKLSRELKKNFPIVEMAIFGSAARGEAGDGSDLDILVLTSEKVSHEIMNKMYGLVFEINLEYLTNISIVIVEADSWHQGIMNISPLYAEVERDGVFLS